MTGSCQLPSSDPTCMCSYLHDAAQDPIAPIEFDPESNEFRIVAFPPAKRCLSVRYCPFCGRQAPRWLRVNLYARISSAEVRRLSNLVKGTRSAEEAIALLGKPDAEEPLVIFSDGGERVVTESGRTFRWYGHSETANIVLNDVQHVREELAELGLGPSVSFSFEAKYIGPK